MMVRNTFALKLYKTPTISCVSNLINAKPDQQYIPRSGSGRGAQNWIDSLRVHVKAGHGGNGHPKYGGVGGKGGDIIIQTSESSSPKGENTTKVNKRSKVVPMKSLYDVFTREFGKDSSKQNIKAESGEDAHRTKLIGQTGHEKILKVPVGVSVHVDEKGSKKLLSNLDKVGEQLLVAQGGMGGGPNNGWLGQKGQAMHIRLDLRLIADLGLVGFPNAGKSTLLKAISKARPKIASYPFTTIKPNLGHIKFEDEREITMADLPGLIEGAHVNVGMGHRFLKHVERTGCMVFVIDVKGFQLNPMSIKRSAFETLVLLNKELEIYNPDLLSKPAICLVNKMDMENSNDNFAELVSRLGENESLYEEGLLNIDERMWPERKINFREIIPISAKHSPKTVEYVKERIRKHLDDIEDEKTNYNEKIQSVSDEIDQMNVDFGPKIA